MKPLVTTEMVSPELAEWWFNKTVYDREAIIYNAYMKERLGGING